METKKTNNKNYKLSLVLCCHNVAKYIDQMMDSILTQEYTNSRKTKKKVASSSEIEIIFIDDCSTDRKQTLNKCKEYSSKFNNIFTYRHMKNKGLSAARNTGIKKARGKYISFPDPDDIMSNGIISKYMDSINNADYDVVCTGIIEKHFDQSNNLVLEKSIVQKTKTAKSQKTIARVSIELEKDICFGYAWNKIYKKSVIDKYKLHFIENINFIEDVLFNIEFFKNAKSLKIINSPAIIYNRRLSSKKSITSKFESNYFELHYLRIESLYNYWKDAGVLDNNAKEILGNLYLRYALSAIWRNKDKKSKMNHKKRIQWITNFYDLEMTKELLKYANSDSLKNKASILLFKTKNKNALLAEATLIDFVTKHMNKILIKARQKR